MAETNVDFLGESFMVADMSTRSRDASLLNSASNVVIKGLRDIGLLPELERLVALAGEGKAGEGKPGEAALRKGLLEERLSCRPGEGRRSEDKTGRSATRPIWSQPKDRVKQAIEGGLPGIDGSANIMPSASLTTLLGGPIKHWRCGQRQACAEQQLAGDAHSGASLFLHRGAHTQTPTYVARRAAEANRGAAI